MAGFDRGGGPPIVVVPGIQGRWEWMRPALDALARDCRTISYSLCGDRGAGATMEWGQGFEPLMRQLDAVLDRAGLDRAVICGASYGGFVALRYAATRPSRASALILASAPGPGWVPSPEQARYVARPWRSIPAFCLTATQRLGPELRASLPGRARRLRFMTRYVTSSMRAPAQPALMARRIRLQQAIDFVPDCAQVSAPALVLSGEAALDRVVPVASTRRYLDLIPGAQYEMMDGTGHLGLLTQPDRFARIVSAFVHAHHY